MATCKEIVIDGLKFVQEGSVKAEPSLPGKRAVLVLDRGWIVAGDVEEKDGRLLVSRALHVRSWSSIGFDGMVANPKSDNVIIKPLPNGFNVPKDAELFRVPVSDDWGL
jgi:hypothetical protein